MGESELRSSFKRLYMDMLTEDAADDLDGFRQAEALDEANGETRGAGGLGESLGALPRGAATCDDAAPSGAHASSTADHARNLAADYGGDMTDKSLQIFFLFLLLLLQ
eukprot:scaffold1141_cov128-Isochrysis_galbana.AAC.21